MVLARHKETKKLVALKVVYLLSPDMDDDHLAVMRRCRPLASPPATGMRNLHKNGAGPPDSASSWQALVRLGLPKLLSTIRGAGGQLPRRAAVGT